MGVGGIDQSVLVRIEAEYARGISSASILDVLASLGVKFSEATLRKWVQLSLLPRSVRVGRKGKHAGSQGMYPATIVRQILQIKEMLADGLTIEQVQTDVLFVRGDLDELQRSLSKVFSTLESALDKVDSQPLRYSVVQDLSHARELAGQLVDKLSEVESRLIQKVELGVKAATGCGRRGRLRNSRARTSLARTGSDPVRCSALSHGPCPWAPTCLTPSRPCPTQERFRFVRTRCPSERRIVPAEHV